MPDHSWISVTLGYVIKFLIMMLNAYLFLNEYVQYKNESSSIKYFTQFSNYIDIIPIFFTTLAILLSIIQKFGDQSEDQVYIKYVRYSNAIASFFIWFKLLYFFRIFRTFGHLIKMLVEVLNDIQTFAIVTIFSLLMFSGTFFILDQNNI